MVDRILNRIRRVNAAYYPQRTMLPPKWLVLGVNNTCNLHCKMCDVGVNYTQSNFYENLMGSKPVHMPMDLFKEIADQAALYFPKVKLGYAFTEPLIYVHLEESLRYAQSKVLSTAITTNGLGLKRWAKVIDETGVTEVNLSLDGPEDIHNDIRGSKHSFAKAIEGIEALAALESKVTVNVYCVITEWNVGRLMEFLKLMEAFPIKTVGLMHSNFTTKEIADTHNRSFGHLYPATLSNSTDTDLLNLNTASLWEEMKAIKSGRWNFDVRFFPEIDSKQTLDRYYQRPDTKIGKRCMDIFSTIMIKSNGDVIPAHGRCYNTITGNMYQQNLKEIWNSEAAGAFRTTVTNAGGLLPACLRCCSSFT